MTQQLAVNAAFALQLVQVNNVCTGASCTSMFNNEYGFAFNGSHGQLPQGPEITNDFPELLKHPSVMSLYLQNQALQAAHVESHKAQIKLTDSALTLQTKVNHLKSELSVSKKQINALTVELRSLEVNKRND